MFLLESLLVTLVKLVDSIPMPAPPTAGTWASPGVSRSAFFESLRHHDGLALA